MLYIFLFAFRTPNVDGSDDLKTNHLKNWNIFGWNNDLGGNNQGGENTLEGELPAAVRIIGICLWHWQQPHLTTTSNRPRKMNYYGCSSNARKGSSEAEENDERRRRPRFNDILKIQWLQNRGWSNRMKFGMLVTKKKEMCAGDEFDPDDVLVRSLTYPKNQCW